MVIGGTGSFGSCLLKRVYGTPDCPELLVFSRDEKKRWEMAQQFPNVTYIVGDIRDQDRLVEAMRGVDYVFHAAAYKQVPACESNPVEAIKTNVMGAINVCRAAITNNVTRVVGLSTDKAVHPINTMGMTKALQEKVFISYDKVDSSTRFINVRYGNVLGSRGSVVPVFVDQAKRKVPYTITHPDMTRFLLTLDDAVTLVLTAMQSTYTGVTLVNKMPASTVTDLAQAVHKTVTGNSSKDAELKFIGVRPGEKIHEALISSDEMCFAYDCGSYFRIDYNTVNPDKHLTYPYTSDVAEQLDVPALVSVLGKAQLV